MEFTTDVFSIFDQKWALLTAGSKSHFNTMTISWGGLGTLWGKPVATVYVRSSRYTHEFMDDHEYFTLSFYPEEYKKSALATLGSKSGRDIDKMHFPGLTAKAVTGNKEDGTDRICSVDEAVTFEEAEITMVCKKLFMQQLDPSKIPPYIADAMYKNDAPHDMYIGEVVAILRK